MVRLSLVGSLGVSVTLGPSVVLLGQDGVDEVDQVGWPGRMPMMLGRERVKASSWSRAASRCGRPGGTCPRARGRGWWGPGARVRARGFWWGGCLGHVQIEGLPVVIGGAFPLRRSSETTLAA